MNMNIGEPLVSVEFEVFGKVQVEYSITVIFALIYILKSSPTKLEIRSSVRDTSTNYLGVAFTKYCKEMCEDLAVNGWVKNTRKGTIQGKLQGQRSKVEQMVMWLSNTGSPGSQVDHCDLTNWQNLATPDYKGFQIRF